MAITKVTRTLLSTGIVDNSNATAITIDSSENVGIGTGTIANESDHKKLKISGASGTGAGIIEFADGSNNIDGAIFSDDGNLFIVADRDNTTADSSIRFRVDGSSEKMRIDSSGNVDLYQGNNLTWRYAAGSTIRGSISVSSADVMTFNNGSSNTERMRIDGSGNVLQGTTTQAGNAALTVKSSAGSNTGIMIIEGDTNNGWGLYSVTSDDSFRITQYTHANTYSDKLTINSSGNVGIGTSSPLYPLHVDRGATGDIAHFEGQGSVHLRIGEASNTMYLNANNGNAAIAFRSNDSEKMRIDASGNVGIGTSSPRGLLEVGNAAGTTDVDQKLYITGDQVNANGNFATLVFSNSNRSGGSTSQISAGREVDNIGTNLQFYTHSTSGSETERMRIDSSGNVGVGTTSPTGKFEVQASSVSGGVVKIQDTDSTVSLSNTLLGLYFPNDNDCTSATFLGMYDSGSRIGSITVTNATSVAFNTTSDERLKENIVDASSKLELVKDIQVREFDWKKDGRHQVGFIAQELNNLVPEAVTEGGEDVTENPWGVDYGKLTPYLVKAIQEQQTIIDNLKTRIETLENA